MVVTMLEAQMPEDQAGLLVEEYRGAGDSLPPFILETFLLNSVGSDLWRIVTVWRSQDALDEYRSSVDTPEGVRMFRAAGAEPTLAIFDVAVHASHS